MSRAEEEGMKDTQQPATSRRQCGVRRLPVCAMHGDSIAPGRRSSARHPGQRIRPFNGARRRASRSVLDVPVAHSLHRRFRDLGALLHATAGLVGALALALALARVGARVDAAVTGRGRGRGGGWGGGRGGVASGRRCPRRWSRTTAGCPGCSCPTWSSRTRPRSQPCTCSSRRACGRS
jgi:hypothetical protein